jgi:LysM domain
MTERGLPIVDGAPACPFVAFEDDRDARASIPDHRHRCYAEARPAPRALAHQEAYCLSSAFPVCPTFQDWARREAARSRADGPRDPEPEDVAAAGAQSQRNPPRDWSAPPPWAAGAAAGVAAGSEDAWGDAGGHEPPSRGQGLSGSYADRVATGAADGSPGGTSGGAPGDDDDEDGGRSFADTPDAAAGTAGVGAAAAAAAQAAARQRDVEDPNESYAAASQATHSVRRERRRDSNAPEWESARPMEAYPTLRARQLPSLSLPPLLVAVVALALAAAVLFALPGLLGFGSPTAVSSPSPSPASSIAAETLVPTAIPEPTEQIYIVQSGDTMSKIAKKFHLALADLIAANKGTIPNPDRLQIGDEVTIPVAKPSELPAVSPASS